MVEYLGRAITGKNPDLCQTCGSCLSRCFLKDVVPEANPRKFVRMVCNGWEDLALESRFLWTCTLCNRCTFDCSMGIRMDEVVRAVRGVQAERGDTPSVLHDGVESALETGNVSMIPKDEFVRFLFLHERVAQKVYRHFAVTLARRLREASQKGQK